MKERKNRWWRWSMLLRWGLILLWLPACNACSEEDPENTDACDQRGECVIRYEYESNGDVKDRSRVCASLAKLEDDQCGVCKNEQRILSGSLQGLPSQRTCYVCNLCKNDFECTTDKDCKTPKPFCQAGQCIACRSNGDCNANTQPFCTETGCVACRDDKDCRDPKIPQCYQGICSACRCPSQDKPHCLKQNDFSIKCVVCTENAHCKAPTPLCDTKTNTCIAGCQADKDCGTGEVCENGSCQSCRAHSDCQDIRKPRCVEGRCGCKENKDCPSEFGLCADGVCVECQKEADCPPGFPRCVGGGCLLKLCTNDRQCTHPNYPVCREVARRTVCVGCTSDKDCTGQRTCDLTTFSCR